MPRFPLVVGLTVAAGLVAGTLAGCTQTPTAAPTSTCAGQIAKVLLADDSATDVTPFAVADIPKQFGIAATPAPTCYYSTVTNPPAINGVSYTVTHRTLLYIGLSDAEAVALVTAVRATVSVAPWTVQYDDGAPAAATPAPGATPTAAPVASSISSLWQYDFSGPSTDDKGEMGYYFARPVTQGTAIHAGIGPAVNVVRVETEFRHPK